jgi:protein SCO1/2
MWTRRYRYLKGLFFLPALAVIGFLAAPVSADEAAKAALLAPKEGARAVLGASLVGGDFRLRDGTGREVTAASFGTPLILMTFGFGSCPDVCPTTLGLMARSLDGLGPAQARVTALFVSLDSPGMAPGRDRPEELAAYAAAIDSRLATATGRPEDIADLLRRYRVRREVRGEGQEAVITHSPFLYLVRDDGRLLRYFPAEIPLQQLVSELESVLAEVP